MCAKILTTKPPRYQANFAVADFLPAAGRVFSAAKRVLLAAERDYLPGERDFLSGKRNFPPGKRNFPSGKHDFPSGKRVCPTGKDDFPAVNLGARFQKAELGGKIRNRPENKGFCAGCSRKGWFQKVEGQKGAN